MAQLNTRPFLRTPRLTAIFVWAAIFSLLCGSRNAYANGRYPKADQLVIAPDDARLLTARTTFGLLLSRDSGQNWDWVCERAIGYSGVQDPMIGLMANGTIIASLSEGIARSTDRGCNWAFSDAPLNGSPVIDLSVRKAAPNQAVALVWDAQQIGYSSRILASEDNGRSFRAHGSPIDPTVLVTTLDSAAGDPHRLYASGTRSVDGVRAALLFTSDDDGEHWSEYPLPFDPKLEQGVYIAAVDPEDPDTVYLRTSSASVSRLLVTHDAGKRVSEVYSGSLLAFALSTDGKQLYFGGEDGLYAGLASAMTFAKRASLRVLCLAATADTLYACSDEHSGFTVGASSDDGFKFQPLLHLKTVRGPLACSAAECESDWPLVRAQLGIPLPSDPGAAGQAGSDAGPSAAGRAGNAENDGAAGGSSTLPQLRPAGSCALGSARAQGALAATLLGLALMSLNLRRKSRARSRLQAK
ncbi:MAG TPA: hypothetical protein VFK05_03340 [Polyangiaceae bacterium]|nr:hypothetical protein [Polyangiaceae bacterium]